MMIHRLVPHTCLILFGFVDFIVVPVIAAPPITALSFSSDGQWIISGSQAGIEVRIWPELTLARTIETSLANIHDISFSPKGDYFLVAGGMPGESGAVESHVWPSGQTAVVCSDHHDLVYQVVWNLLGDHWITASWDGTCHVYDANSHRVLTSYAEHSGPVLAVDCIEPAMAISAGVDGTIRLWDMSSGKHVRTLENHTRSVQALSVRGGDEWKKTPWLASASEDRTVRFWQPVIGRLMRFAKTDSAPVSIAWSQDNKLLVVALQDGEVQWLDPQTLAIAKQANPKAGRIFSMAVSPSNGQVAIGTAQGVLRVDAAK